MAAKPDDGATLSLALTRGLGILSCFTEGTPELSISEIAAAIGVNVGSVHRLMATLEHLRAVSRTKGGKYRLGLRNLGLARVVLNTAQVRIDALPHMRELANLTKANVSLAMMDDGEIVYIERVPSPLIADPYHHSGRRAPAHCTALGKVLLAFAPPGELEVVVRRGLPPLAENTIVDAVTLKAELENVQRDEYAQDNSEYTPGSHCLAAPIRDGSGDVIAAMSLSTARTLIDREGLLGHLHALLQTCSKISYKLGYSLFDPHAKASAPQGLLNGWATK